MIRVNKHVTYQWPLMKAHMHIGNSGWRYPSGMWEFPEKNTGIQPLLVLYLLLRSTGNEIQKYKQGTKYLFVHLPQNSQTSYETHVHNTGWYAQLCLKYYITCIWLHNCSIIWDALFEIPKHTLLCSSADFRRGIGRARWGTASVLRWSSAITWKEQSNTRARGELGSEPQ